MFGPQEPAVLSVFGVTAPFVVPLNLLIAVILQFVFWLVFRWLGNCCSYPIFKVEGGGSCAKLVWPLVCEL